MHSLHVQSMFVPFVPVGTIPLVWKPLLHACGLLLTPVLDVGRLVPSKGVHTPGLEPSPGRSLVFEFTLFLVFSSSWNDFVCSSSPEFKGFFVLLFSNLVTSLTTRTFPLFSGERI